MIDGRYGQAEERERLRALQLDLDAAGILPKPPRTVVQTLGPLLAAIAAALLGSGLGLAAVLAGWVGVIYLS